MAKEDIDVEELISDPSSKQKIRSQLGLGGKPLDPTLYDPYGNYVGPGKRIAVPNDVMEKAVDPAGKNRDAVTLQAQPYQITNRDPERGIVGNMAESWNRGIGNIGTTFYDWSIAGDDKEGRKVRDYDYARNAGDPIKTNGFVDTALSATAGMLPELIFGAGLAALGGAVGAAAAGTAAATGYWWKQGASDTYDTLIRNNVDPDIAAKVSIPVGLAYAAVENLQMTQFPGMKQLTQNMGKSAGSFFAKRLAGLSADGLEKAAYNAARKVGGKKLATSAAIGTGTAINAAVESSEEAVQQAITDWGEEIATGIHNYYYGDTNPAQRSAYLDHKFDNAVNAFTSSLTPMSMIGLGTRLAAKGVRSGNRALMNQQFRKTLNNVEKNLANSAPDEIAVRMVHNRTVLNSALSDEKLFDRAGMYGVNVDGKSREEIAGELAVAQSQDDFGRLSDSMKNLLSEEPQQPGKDEENNARREAAANIVYQERLAARELSKRGVELGQGEDPILKLFQHNLKLQTQGIEAPRIDVTEPAAPVAVEQPAAEPQPSMRMPSAETAMDSAAVEYAPVANQQVADPVSVPFAPISTEVPAAVEFRQEPVQPQAEFVAPPAAVVEPAEAAAPVIPAVPGAVADSGAMTVAKKRVGNRAQSFVEIDPESEQLDPAKKSEIDVARSIANSFGKQVTFFYDTNDNPKEHIDGFTTKGHILLNTKSAGTMIPFITGHEVFHRIADENRESFNRLASAVRGVVANEDRFNEKLNEYRRQRSGETFENIGVSVSEDAMMEEFLADFVASEIFNADFWQKLAKSDLTLAKKMLAILDRLAKDFLRALNGNMEQYNEVFGDNIEVARDMARQFIAEAEETQAKIKKYSDVEKRGRSLFTSKQLSELDRLGIDVSNVPERYKNEAINQLEFLQQKESELNSGYYNELIAAKEKAAEERRKNPDARIPEPTLEDVKQAAATAEKTSPVENTKVNPPSKRKKMEAEAKKNAKVDNAGKTAPVATSDKDAELSTMTKGIDRVRAFLNLADGLHTINGVTFTKKDNGFIVDGKKISARGIDAIMPVSQASEKPGMIKDIEKQSEAKVTADQKKAEKPEVKKEVVKEIDPVQDEKEEVKQQEYPDSYSAELDKKIADGFNIGDHQRELLELAAVEPFSSRLIGTYKKSATEKIAKGEITGKKAELTPLESIASSKGLVANAFTGVGKVRLAPSDVPAIKRKSELDSLRSFAYPENSVDARPVLEFIYVNDGYAYATNGKMLAKFKTDMSDGLYKKIGDEYIAHKNVGQYPNLKGIFLTDDPLDATNQSPLINSLGKLISAERVMNAGAEIYVALKFKNGVAYVNPVFLAKAITGMIETGNDSFAVERRTNAGGYQETRLHANGNEIIIAGVQIGKKNKNESFIEIDMQEENAAVNKPTVKNIQKPKKAASISAQKVKIDSSRKTIDIDAYRDELKKKQEAGIAISERAMDSLEWLATDPFSNSAITDLKKSAAAKVAIAKQTGKDLDLTKMEEAAFRGMMDFPSFRDIGKIILAPTSIPNFKKKPAMDVLSSLVAKNEIRKQLEYIRVENGYGYASGASVFGGFKVDIPDGFYKKVGNEYIDATSKNLGELYNIDRLINSGKTVETIDGSRFIDYIGEMISAAKLSGAVDKVSVALKLDTGEAFFDPSRLVKGITAMIENSGKSFVVEVKKDGDAARLALKSGDNIVLIGGLSNSEKHKKAAHIEIDLRESVKASIGSGSINSRFSTSEDRNAFITGWEARLGKIASRYKTSPVDRDTLMQSGRLAIDRALQSFNPDKGSNVDAYVASAVRNAMVNEINSANKEARSTISMQLEDQDGLTLQDRIASKTTAAPGDRMIERESERSLNDWMKKLPERDRSILIRRRSGKSVEQIGAEVGISKALVSMRLKKMRNEASDSIKMSINVQDMPDTIKVNGISRPTTNSKGAPIADTEEKVRNFWRWFGDSKVVDENGKPLVVYKGMMEKDWRTGNKITVINSPNGPWAGFFTSEKEVAKGFQDAFRTMGDTVTLEVYLKISNPYIIDAKGKLARDFMFDNSVFGEDPRRPDARSAFSSGYDAVIIKNTKDEGDVFVPKNSAQIKSATDNTGAYSEDDDDIRFSIRTKNPPEKTGIGYKVFVVKKGKLYPPMVNPTGKDTPVGVWLDAEDGVRAGESKTGRPQVKAGGPGTQGGGGTLAYRPGWHLGEYPLATQFNRMDEDGNKTLFPADFVWAEVEYANDFDYQKEAEAEGITASGNYQHSLAWLKKIPVDGSYRYRTNPNPETVPWIISGAMKVNRILRDDEVESILSERGIAAPKRQGENYPDIRFSIADAKGENLIAVHNVSVEKLRSAAKLGAMPMPSIAIIDAEKSDFSNFGDITLIGDKNLIDPRNRENQVFNADVYSPRRPTVEYEFSEKDKQKIRNAIGKYEDKAGNDWGKSINNLLENLTDDNWQYRLRSNYMVVNKYADEKGLGKIDQYSTGSIVYSKEYEDWFADFLNNIGLNPKERIFDGYTPSGRRRYLDNNLDNVIKLMRKEKVRGGEGFFYGAGSLRAHKAKKFKSISEIQKHRDSIVTEQQFKEVKESVEKKYNELTDEIEKAAKGGIDFNGANDAVVAFIEGGSDNRKYLQERFSDQTIFQKIQNFVDGLSNLETEYFEAKLRRPVKFNEFVAAVVPKSIPADVRKILENAGLDIAEYENQQDRVQAIKDVSERNSIRFSIATAQPFSEANRAAVDELIDGKTRLGQFASSFVEAYRKEDRNKRPDLSAIDTLLWMPRTYADKVPAFRKIFDAALDMDENKNMTLAGILQDVNGVSMLGSVEAYAKQNKEEWKKITDYLWKRDREQMGGYVKADGKGWFVAFSDIGNQLGKFKDQEEAWMSVFLDEADSMVKDKGYSADAANAVLSIRRINRRDHEVLFNRAKETIDEFQRIGVDAPVEFVDLFEELRKMGDRGGYYMPRIRHGKYQLRAYKDGENPRLETFDTPFMRQLRAAKLIREGYTVDKAISDKPSEDAYEFVDPAAINDVINVALERLRNKEATFSDYGISGHWQDYKRKDGTTEKHFVINAKDKVYNDLFKDLGGQYYDDGWRFKDPSGKIDKEILESIIGEFGEEIRISETMAAALTSELAAIIHARGSGSRKIGRSDLVGEEVYLGYEEDALRAIAIATASTASGAAKSIVAKKMTAAFTGRDVTFQQFKDKNMDKTIKENTPEYVEEMRRLHSDYAKLVESKRIHSSQDKIYREAVSYMKEVLRNNSGSERVVGFIRSLASIKFLSSPSSAVINMTAMLTNAPAVMMHDAKISPAASVVLFSKAMKDYVGYVKYAKFGNGSEPNAENKWIFDNITKRGWDQSQMNQEATRLGTTFAPNMYRKLSDMMLFLFSSTESMNRASTIAGAFRGLANKEGGYGKLSEDRKMELLRQAKSISDRAHGIYGKVNLPAWARGENMGAQGLRSFYMFKTFTHNYFALCKEFMAQKDVKSLAYLLGAAVAVGGPTAFPIWQIIKWMWEALSDDDDPEESFYKTMAELGGAPAENVSRYGMLGLLGINASGSLGIQYAMPENMGDFLGAPYSFGEDVFVNAPKYAAQGNYLKMLESLAPRFAANPIKAYREATEGITGRGNAPVYYGNEQLRLDWQDAIFRRMFGFNPASVSSKREKMWSEKKVAANYSENRNQIYALYRKWLTGSRNVSDLMDVKSKVVEYNARVKRNNPLGVSMITEKSLASVRRNVYTPNKAERERAELESKPNARMLQQRRKAEIAASKRNEKAIGGGI